MSSGRRYLEVALGVAARNLRRTLKTPSLLIPPIVAPVIFFATFAGGMSGMGRAPGFDFPSGYTAFQFVFVMMQAGIFTGIFTGGFALALDFESGFARRLMMAAPRRSALLLGYAISSVARAAIVIAVLFAVALAVGMPFDGSIPDLVALTTIPVLLSVVAVLWGAGLALRFRTIQAAPLMQIPVFLALFLAPVFAPLDLMTGWIHQVATYNPVTYFLQAGRGLISGSPTALDLAFGSFAALVPLLTLWSVRSLRRAERAV